MPAQIDNEEFISRLTTLFESTKDTGSVWLTWKRYHYQDGEEMKVDPIPQDETRYPCLLRASTGDKKSKLSTLITIDQLPNFHAILSALLKSSMNTMRKRDKKRERLKSEKTASRKKKLQEPIQVIGPKRGSGRRKRQRLLRAVKKREGIIQRQEERERLRARQALNKSQ